MKHRAFFLRSRFPLPRITNPSTRLATQMHALPAREQLQQGSVQLHDRLSPRAPIQVRAPVMKLPTGCRCEQPRARGSAQGGPQNFSRVYRRARLARKGVTCTTDTGDRETTTTRCPRVPPEHDIEIQWTISMTGREKDHSFNARRELKCETPVSARLGFDWYRPQTSFDSPADESSAPPGSNRHNSSRGSGAQRADGRGRPRPRRGARLHRRETRGKKARARG